ncbi:uncharacterized protein LOC109712202 [Ananas comosus]|uniref:Uncharacterized protein LOC109712202 n=1 Tax=Ananas comosus TaxID=4615 RepID=A0A6P5FD39_ANACO|nr:uncharacterized protein LOC109712202 [Ananas comosus]XP_020091226.1 uncharacterized protein LOC109712202 [Ananas comosus]XP_020091227.1 uncharacterized protein LOC109712202 [Ananas comosus]XP_020091228.1 uncharacterized protein LOC109712202 [Ananas comosus]XP_020091229.1 uncharacterized protein LOC109712202 [Ananas comosus]XP_020091230.1 uncharacterized protein LOC109712202 [Ananas comosus]
MAFSLFLAILVLMATGGGRGRRRGRRGATKRTRLEEETSGSDFDHYESSFEEEANTEERTDKGKRKAPETSKKKKGASFPPRRNTGRPVIREQGSSERERRFKHAVEVQSVDAQRQKAFASRTCLAERFVNFNELTREVPEFEHLLQKAPIEPVGMIQARAAFCVELIREFYMRGNVLVEDQETGTYLFETHVRGIRILVTPHTIGEIFGLNVDTTGLQYTHGTIQQSSHWNTVINAICKSGTVTNRLYVESKDLKPEYHILSLVICYNVLPTIGTKRIRWDRLVLLYLLGHPERADGLNINVPFLMWQKMAHVIQASRQRVLLLFPILITRILQANGVDITCNKYDYGLGPIDGVTLAKSISTLKTFQQMKAYTTATFGSTTRPVEREGSSSSGGVITLESLHHELRTIKKLVEQSFKKVEDGIKKILEILECRHDDVFPGGTRPSSSHPIESSTAGAHGDAEEREDDDHEGDDE